MSYIELAIYLIDCSLHELIRLCINGWMIAGVLIIIMILFDRIMGWLIIINEFYRSKYFLEYIFSFLISSVTENGHLKTAYFWTIRNQILFVTYLSLICNFGSQFLNHTYSCLAFFMNKNISACCCDCE